MPDASRNPFRTAVRYLLVGLANTAIYTVLLYAFLRITQLPTFLAVAISFVLAMCFQYTANRVFTFASSASPWEEVPRYLIVALANYVVSFGVVTLVFAVLGRRELEAAISSSVVTAVLGYVASHYWVYGEKR